METLCFFSGTARPSSTDRLQLFTQFSNQGDVDLFATEVRSYLGSISAVCEFSAHRRPMGQDIGDTTYLRDGRSISGLARVHGVHRSWLYKLLAVSRFNTKGA
jgi:hypothetical protein